MALTPYTSKVVSIARRMTGFHRFPLSNFKYFLTLFSKFFSSFPHGTCSLSVSGQYLALDEVYHPFWAAIPSYSTLWTCIVRGELRVMDGIFTLYDPLFQKSYTRVTRRKQAFRLQLECRKDTRFSFWAFPASLAVTRGILVSFFSSAYWYA